VGRFFLMVCCWVDSLIIIIKVSNIIRITHVYISQKYSTVRSTSKTLGVSRCLSVSRAAKFKSDINQTFNITKLINKTIEL
jgi:hypothetical protein